MKAITGGGKSSANQAAMAAQQAELQRQQQEAKERELKEKRRADELALRAMRRGKMFSDDVEPGMSMQSVLRANREGL